MRAPLAASAVSNLLVGYFLSAPSEGGMGSGRAIVCVLLLILATCCFYWGGMVLNDWFDRDRDRELYPHRPLPSERVDPGVAVFLGGGLLFVGVASSALASTWAGHSTLRGLLAGGMVVLSVLAYDAFLKRFRGLGSLAMASCRGTNVLLAPMALGFPADSELLVYVALIVLYIFSLTLLSTFEDEDAPSLPLVGAFLGCLTTPLILIVLSAWPLAGTWGLAGIPFAALLFLIVLGQLIAAMVQGTARRGGAMTRSLLKSIWWIDLATLLGVGAFAALGAWATLFVVGSLGAKALFRPPTG
jgi:4-hydroxybenzoate polyprenyltransferase